MNTDKNLHFITNRILETNVALMHCFTSNLLTIPNSVVTTYKVDANGCIWFFISRPKHVVSQLEKEFPVNLGYFKKGSDYSMKIHGKARIIVDPEELNSLELSLEEVRNAMSNQLLICVKILKVDYFEYKLEQNNNFMQKIKSFMYELFDWSQSERSYNFSTSTGVAHYGY